MRFIFFILALFCLQTSFVNANDSVPKSKTNLEYEQYVPGPNQYLFSHPFYSCLHNYYVSTSGSDSNNGTSVATAWATLAHANSAAPSAGYCINVLPGTYSGVQLTHSGNLASSTGYIVYRCTQLDACTINGTAGINNNAAFFASGVGSANYVIIDGFTMVGNDSVYGIGVVFTESTNGGSGTFGSHHDWVLNSVIHNFGQSGIAFANGDYTYAIHNKVYDNADAPSCDNGAQGSGIADNVPLDISAGVSNYTATADDKVSSSKLIGSFVTGTTWFHKVYSWNVLYNNHLTNCGTGDTDGNNIILDTFNTGNGNSVTYPDQTLISYNIAYNAGGGGIHIFYSEYATIANNTVYNNYLDPYITGSTRAGIDTNDSYGNTLINNISVAIPAAPSGSCAYNTAPYAQFNNAIIGAISSSETSAGDPIDTFSHNITQLQGGNNSCLGSFGLDSPTGEVVMYNGDSGHYSTSNNKVATNPMWVNVGGGTVGTQSTPPTNTNFALQPGSPAIGYGLTETYLPSVSTDVGACIHQLTKCP